MILSIIIPTYNRNEKLIKLLQTLQLQMQDNVEVIVVDDHSDKPLKLEFPSWLTYIYLPENSGGASVPRNVGLDIAKGKFITFIDSDDMVKPHYIKSILSKIRYEDFDYCYFSWECNTHKVIIRNEPPGWNCCVWNCVYKKERIGNTRFRPDLKIAEDYYFNLEVRRGIRANIPDILYYYEEFSPDSLVNAGITYNDKYRSDDDAI